MLLLLLFFVAVGQRVAVGEDSSEMKALKEQMAKGDAKVRNYLGFMYATGHIRMPHDPSLPMVVLQLRRTQVIEDYKQVN
jgi:hypothetical protein